MVSPSKVLVITPRLPWPLNDGGSIAMHQSLVTLNALGYDVTLLSINPEKHFVTEHALNQYAKVSSVSIDTTPNIWKALANYFFQSTPYPVIRFLHPEFSALIIKTLRENDFQFIQLETLFVTPYLDVIRHNTKAPIIFRAHNAESEIYYRHSNRISNALKKYAYRILAKSVQKYEANISKNVKGIITITREDKSYFSKAELKSALEFIPLYVQNPTINLEPKPEIENSIAYLGALNWEPNLQGLQWFMDQVLPIVIKKIPTIKVHIAGKDPGKHAMLWQSSTVSVTGNIAEPISFLQCNNVVFVPVFIGSGVRLKLLESMALGKAIVTTAVGAQGLSVTHQREIMICNDPDSFAEAILYLLQNPNERKAMGMRAQEYIRENHDKEVIIGQTKQFYDIIAG